MTKMPLSWHRECLANRRRWPHVLWGLSATMVFPKVTRDVAHYGLVWGPWFFGFAYGGKQHVK